MNSSIVIIEKPEWINYEDIHSVLRKAHEVNRKNGVEMLTASLNGAGLEQRIGENGRCFVAVAGKEILGTVSASIEKKNRWYAKENVVDLKLLGVIPEATGKGVASSLVEHVFDFARINNICLVELDTAENNINAIKIYEKKGFVLVDYFTSPNTKHYSVVMAKWMDDLPYSECKRKLFYGVKKLYIRLRYKVGKKKRFFL